MTTRAVHRRGTGTAAALLLASLLTAGLALTACGDGAADVNAAIDTSNAAIDRANELDTQASAALEEALSLESGVEASAQAGELLDKADRAMAGFAEQTAIVKTEFARIAAMNVSGDLRTYAAQQIEIAELESESTGVAGDIIGKTRELYTLSGMPSTDSRTVAALTSELDSLLSELEALEGTIAEKADASERFFDERGLGTR